MDLSKEPVATAKMIGGRLCLDFANTVGGRRAASAPEQKGKNDFVVIEDRLLNYFDLLAWSLRAGLLTNTAADRLVREAKRREGAAKSVWKRAVALREAIYRISAAIAVGEQPRSVDLEILNQELAVAHGRVRLALSADGGFVWEWIDTREDMDQMLWRIADSAAEMLTTGDMTRLRRCGGEDCGWLFEDTSRNRSRQWCVMEDCGNVAKVRRFRSRLRNRK
jgi:predicted RNA-binding Zn ribbon-like protein